MRCCGRRAAPAAKAPEPPAARDEAAERRAELSARLAAEVDRHSGADSPGARVFRAGLGVLSADELESLAEQMLPKPEPEAEAPAEPATAEAPAEEAAQAEPEPRKKRRG